MPHLSLQLILIFLLCPTTKALPTPTLDSLSLKPPNLAQWDHLNKTCLALECNEQVNVEHLQQMASYMDRAINPCENFHAYACSNWQLKHRQHKTVMSQGEQQLNDKYEKMFKSRDLREDPIMQKMQLYFDKCLESEREEKASWQQYIKKLRELGYLHWNNNNNYTHWLDTLRELNQFSNGRHFISLQVERFNATLYTLFIDPHSTMERVNFSLEIYEILKLFTNDSYSRILREFKTLESDLENILNTSCLNAIVDENNECDLTEWLKYEDLINSNSSVNWEYLLKDFSLQRQDQIYVNDLKNIEKIKLYLDQANQKTLFLYSVARFINFLQSHTHNIVDKGSGAQSCLRHMRKHFPLFFNYLYEKLYYGPQRSQSDQVILQVFSQLKQQFSLILDSNDMNLSFDSLQYLKKKLHYLKLNIGNLPQNASQQFYKDFIMDLNITHNFYTNHLMALKHYFQHQRLLASTSKFDPVWFSFNLHMPNFLDNMDSTAYYFGIANFIILPYAYLQLPFYDHRFWPSLLFGDLANTLGHELMHAFDSKFLEYDYGGNLNELESQAILNNKNFQYNIACLSQEPTKFLTERIADISGTHLALKTFVQDPLFLKHNGKLFFLQFAQFFCGAASMDSFASEDDLHDMDSVRLNYTLAHMPEFAEVFQCPLGSPMNPLEKCKLW